MTFARQFVCIAAVLASVIVGGPLVACSDDAKPGPTPSAAAVDGGPAPLLIGPLVVSDAPTRIFLGQSLPLEGLAPGIVTEITFEVVEAPFASVAPKTVQTATTFTPDVLGTFAVRVTGRKENVQSSLLVLVEALDAPIFWMETGFDVKLGPDGLGKEGTRFSAVRMGAAAGAVVRDLACKQGPYLEIPDRPDDEFYSPILGANGADVWEAPAGGVHRFVYPGLSQAGNVMTMTVTAITSESRCGADTSKVIASRDVALPPPRDPDADPAPEEPDPVMSELIMFTRFSPDGSRVGYVEEVGGKTRLSSVGFDGSGKRALSPFQSVGGKLDANASAIRGPDGAQWPPIPPHWRDATHLGWVTFFDAKGGAIRSREWEIYAVEDREGATAERVMHCSAGVLSSFDFVTDDSIVAVVDNAVNVYRANHETKECELVRSLSKLGTSVALSRDRTMATFFGATSEVAGAEDQVVIFTAGVDGTVPAAPVPGARGTRFSTEPRWAAAGAVITWSEVGYIPGLSLQLGSVWAIPARGGVARRVVTGRAEETSLPDGNSESTDRRVFGIASSCSHVPARGGASASGWGTALGVMLLVGRRRLGTARTAGRKR